MHGNVWETFADRWQLSPKQGPSDGSAWLEPDKGLSGDNVERRLLRGGSWFNDLWYCRSAYRLSELPGYRGSLVGFHVCCLPPGPS